MQTRHLQAVVFDFDGTLAELHLDFALMKRKVGALAANYLEETPEPGQAAVLEWLDELAKKVAALHGRETGLEYHTRARFLIMDMELEAAGKGRLYPFTRKMLTGLEERGVKTAIITRNCTAAVRIVFPDAFEHCSCLLARDDVTCVKPAPGHLLTALERIGAAPEKSLMVGDHLLDLATGRAAGTMVAAVDGGSLDIKTLSAASPDFAARDCAALMRELENNGLLPPAA